MGEPLCRICGDALDLPAFASPTRAATICAACRAQQPPFRAARSAFVFGGPLREAVHRLKYEGKLALAPRLAPLLSQAMERDTVLSGFAPQFLVPVPLHRARQRQRGTNQSALLAHELGRQLNIPVAPCLRRTRDTPPQVELNRAQRQSNVRDAFALDAALWAKIGGRGARLLLLDDVFTTGATLSECARALQRGGAGEICALTLARQTRH